MRELRKLSKIIRNLNLYKNKKGIRELTENEFEAARYLTKKPGISQNDLSDYLNVDKGLVTRIVIKLEKLEYITVNVNPDDQRKKQLYATNKAFLLKEADSSEDIEFFDAITKDISKEELEEFNITLNKLYLESKNLRKNKFEGI